MVGVVEDKNTFKELGEIDKIEIEIVLEDTSDNAIYELIELIECLGIPIGSKIINGDDETEIGNLEGLAIYINGVDLPKEIYEKYKINDVVEELEKLLDGIGKMYSYWNGPIETAFYFYGESFEDMKDAIEDFVKEHPLCEKCRIVKIA